MIFSFHVKLLVIILIVHRKPSVWNTRMLESSHIWTCLLCRISIYSCATLHCSCYLTRQVASVCSCTQSPELRCRQWLVISFTLDHFTSRDRAQGVHWIAGWMGSRAMARVRAMAREKKHCPYREWSLFVQCIAQSLYWLSYPCFTI
jgi:hypothetical protein